MSVHYQVQGATAAAIAASVEAGIRTGGLSPGSVLPPIRRLAGELDVSPATVAAAYATLRQRGLLETAGRNGTRIRQRPALGVKSGQLLEVPPNAVDLSSGAPDSAALPDLGPTLARLDPATVNYRDGGVLPEVSAEARRRLAADGIPAADLALTSGALDAIERLLAAHTAPGDAVGVEDPGWSSLIDLLAAMGLRAEPIPVDDAGPTVDGLAAALTAGIRAVVITSRAQNPTGAALSAERSAALRALLHPHAEVLVIEDDHSGDLAEVPLHTLAGKTPTWAYIRSVSKAYGPDLRVAIVVGDPATIGRVAGRLRFGAGWVSTILQRVVVELWRSPTVAEQVSRASGRYAHRRQALLDALASWGLTGHGVSGINVWLPVPDEATVVARLRDQGWAVAPGAAYRHNATPGIRITVSTLPDDQITSLAAAVAAAATPIIGRGV